MDSTPTAGPPAPKRPRFEQQLREMNEALLVSSVRQHELAEQAQKAERALAKALAYGDDIIATLREPFLVLDHDLRVKTANRSFYDSFHVSKEETENRLVYDLGNGQWDIPAYGSCWMKSFPATNRSTTLRLNTPSRLSVARPCCSTLGHSLPIPNTLS